MYYCIIAVADHLYKVVYNRIDEQSIEFTCIMACMSPVIEGCAVTLRNSNSMFKVINNSTRVKGNLNNFNLHQISVHLNGLKPFTHYDYTATPLIKNKRDILRKRGTVSALKKAGKGFILCMCKYMSFKN